MKSTFTYFLLCFCFCLQIAKAQLQIGLGKTPKAIGITVANGKIYTTNPEQHYIGVTSLSTGRVNSFGSFGSTNGLVNMPIGITADPNGKIYVGEAGGSRVQIFDANGNYIGKFGTFGNLPGQLSGVTAVFYGPDNRIYVGESNNDRISVFDASYNFLYSFGSTGNGNGLFNFVYGIFVDQQQRIYTIDFNNMDIQIFDGSNNGAFLSRFASTGITQSGNGIAVDLTTGNIFASDYSKIFKYASNGTLITSFNSPNNRQIYIDQTSRHLWVAGDTGVLMEYDLNGNLLATYGSANSTNESDNLSSPKGVVVDGSGNIIVSTANSTTYEIKKYNSAGQFINKFPVFYKQAVGLEANGNIIAVGNGELRRYNGTGTSLAAKALGYSSERVALSSDGKIYIPRKDDNNVNDRIEVYNADFTLNRTIGTPGTGDGQFQSPEDLALDGSNNLYVLDNLNKTVQKFTSADGFLWKITFANPIISLTVSPNGEVYIVENDKIKKYDTNGNFISSFGSAGLNLGQFYRPRYVRYHNGNMIISDESTNRLMIVPPTPEIGITLAGGNEVTNGGSIAIGNAPLGSSLNATFNIVSQGIEPLQLTGNPKVVLSGPNAADFTIDQTGLAGTINGAASFKVTYTGNSNGQKSATLTLATNDPNESSFSFTIQATTKLEQTISNFNAIADKVYGDNSFTISATASSGLPVQFTSSNTNVATVSGNTITIVGAGLTNITATQNGNSDYNAAIEVVRPLQITKAPVTVSASNLQRAFGESNPTTQITYQGFKNGETSSVIDVLPIATIATSATANANAGTEHTISVGGATDNNYSFTYTNGKLTIIKAVATIQITNTNTVYNGEAKPVTITTNPASLPVTVQYNNNSLVPVNAGSYEVTVSINHINYQGSSSTTLTIAKANASILMPNETVVYNGQTRVMPYTTIPSGLTLTMIYKRNGEVSEPKNAATYEVTATLENNNYNEVNAQATLTISKAVATISLSNLEQTYNGTKKSVTVITNPTELSHAVEFKQNGNVINDPVEAGSYEVTVSVTDPNAEAANATGTLVIGKATQTIVFESISEKKFGDGSFDLMATSDANLPITFTSSDPTIAKVNLTKVEIIKAGSVTFTAKQVGNSNYMAAEKTQTIIVQKATQTITFHALESKIFGASPFELSATSSTGLPITYESSNPLIAKVINNKVEILKAGLVNITAKQIGNDNYEATEITQSLTIQKASQSMTFNTIENKLDTSAPFTLIASASSGLAITFEVVSGPATIAGNTVTLTKQLGTVVIRAIQAGNESYHQASKEQTFTVTKDVVAGIGERFDGDVTVGPNPTSDVININLFNHKLKVVYVYDLTGKITQHVELEVPVAEQTLSIAGNVPGIYLVDMRTDEGFKIVKRIKIN